MLKIFKTQNSIKKICNRLLIIFLFICCVSLGVLYSPTSYAATTCTTDNNGQDQPGYDQTNISIISDITKTIKKKLFGLNTAMYLFTTSDFGFIVAIDVMLTLYIIVYAISFMTGLIPIKLYDFLIRIVKISVMVSLIGPGSWYFFNQYLVGFFNSVVDEIISYITTGGKATSPIPPPPIFAEIINPLITSYFSADYAFVNIDATVGKIFSPKTFVTLLALFMAEPYGKFYFLIMMIAIWSFMRALMTAMWIYIMSLVVRTLLLGLAPIFIPTIMFQRTRHIFDGWLNQLVSASLQPILLFVFFIFFIRLMQGTMDSILNTPVCFSKYPSGWSGSSFDFSFWEFAVKDPVNGWVENTKGFGTYDTYPVNQMAIYTFLLVAEIGNRFNSVAIQIAAQIAQAGSSLIGSSPADEIKNRIFKSNVKTERPKSMVGK